MCVDCCVFDNIADCPLVFYWEKELLESEAIKRNITLKFQPYLVVRDGESEFVYMYRWIINGRCPFLKGSICSIHANKPLSCRIFPLITDIEKSRIYISSRCRWILENRDYIIVENVAQQFDEFSIAVKTMAMLKEFLELAKEYGWEIILMGRNEATHI